MCGLENNKDQEKLFSVLISHTAFLAGPSQSRLPPAWVMIQRTEGGMGCSIETIRYHGEMQQNPVPSVSTPASRLDHRFPTVQ